MDLDPVVTNPDHYRPVFENDDVRVLEYTDEPGTVTINDHLFSFGEPTASWGGLGKSGIGRSHGVHGLMELVNVKHVSVDLQDSPSAPWWYPYDGAFQKFTRRAFGTLYARDPRTKIPEALGLMGSGRFFGYVKMSTLARGIGLRIPEDLSVIGFDSTEICNHTSPALTSVRQPVYEMAARAFERAASCADRRPCGHHRSG